MQKFRDMANAKQLLQNKPQLLDRYLPQPNAIDTTNNKMTNRIYKIADLVSYFSKIRKSLPSIYCC